MALTIYNNIASLTSQRYLGQTNSATSKTLERLSSGLRINHASDDASGLAISEKLRGQISGLKRASMNAQDGISMLQTGEGALQEVQNIIQRMRELAVQAANGTYTSNDRKEIQKEVDQLKSEIDRISSSTEFNTKKLLNGDATALWSTDKAGMLDTVVKSKVAEGNYNINVSLQQAGKNYVYKSDVMTLNEGAIGAEITDASTTGILRASDPASLPQTGTAEFTLAVANLSVAVTTSIATAGTYLQAGSSWSVSTASTTVVSVTEGGYALVEFTSTSAAKISYYSGKDGSLINTVTDDNITDGISANIIGGIEFSGVSVLGTNIQAGDKFVLNAVAGNTAVGTAVLTDGAITLSDGPDGSPAMRVVYSGLVSASNETTVSIAYGSLDSNTGNFNIGTVNLTFAQGEAVSNGNAKLAIKGGGEAATSTTKLKDIARFTTADGRNIFDNTQELTVFGNGNQATIYLEGDDTISDFEQKLNDAIVNKLGMGTSSTSVNNNLVNYVAPGSAQDGTNEAVNGTFVIQSALLGENSQLSFIGDQALINGLSLATIQEGQESTVKVNVTDVHTGANVGSDLINDSKVKGIIDGVEVNLASNIGVDVSWDSTNKEVTFNPGEAVDIKLHLVDNSTDLQIGANEGQAINVSIAQIDTKSLGLEDVLMVDQASAQKAITKLDKALEFVSSTRATIGAQINRLESAISNLNTARENLSASESRIRDLDMAEEMANFTRNQILSQAGTAMLAQANQLPQMALQLLQ